MDREPPSARNRPRQLIVRGFGFLVIVIAGLVIGPYGDAHRIAVLDAVGLAMVGIGFPVSVSFFIRAHRIRRQLQEDEDELLRMLSGKD